MSWSYSGDPSSSDRDELRFLIGDTDTNDQQLSNEELDFLLSEYGSPLDAAIAAVQSLISKYSRYVTQKTGDISVNYSDIIKHYMDLLSVLEAKLATSLGTPYAGGISIDDKEVDEDDTDRVDPAFEVGMMDNN